MQRYFAVVLISVLLASCSNMPRQEPIKATANVNALADDVVPPPSPTSKYDEGEIEPVQGWTSVETFHGSGMGSFCTKASVKEPWRLRWRVGKTSNAKFGSGDIRMELTDRNSTSWKKVLTSERSSTVYISDTFTNTVKSLCIFARSKYTSYVILVEKKAK
jgi:hypothetical protein